MSLPGVNLLEFDLDALAAFCETLGEKRFRATQLFRWIHQRGVADFGQMSDLAKSLREKLAGSAHVAAPPVTTQHISKDGTIKWLFDVGGGNAIETVFIPEDDRGTLCISSQAGCAVGCRFCSTGHQGFSRNLTTVRKTRGDDIDAACGQLAGDVQDRTRVRERMARGRTTFVRRRTPAATGDSQEGKTG